jgi:transcription-repair coupling factor (superfamily II helicase)
MRQLALRPGVQDVDDNPHFPEAADLSVVRGAEDPLARLHAHIRNTPHRVLLLAESDGRRESLLDFLRASGINPPAFDSLAEFQASDEKVGIATAPLARASAGSRTASTSSPRPSCSPPAPPRAAARSRSRSAMSRR